MTKVAILVAPQFEEIELTAPLDILRRLGIDVTLAGIASDQVTGAHGMIIQTDTRLDRLNLSELDGLILPGGGGSWIMKDTPEVIRSVQEVYHSGKLVAAICAAPMVLAEAGIVCGKNVTSYPMDEVHQKLIDAGAQLQHGERVVTDGNVLTANGPATALLFGYAIGEYFGLREQTAQVKQQMCF